MVVEPPSTGGTADQRLRRQLRLGDLVFVGSDKHHVGIYAGEDKMVHAPGPGAVVTESTIHWSQGISLRRYDTRTGSHAALLAKQQLGVPYVFGGASLKGFDASGLTMYEYALLGVALPHGATDQQKQTKPVPLGQLRRGDLVFWGNKEYSYHVAIYMGHGRAISAPHTGAVVSYGPLKGAWIGGRLLPVR